MHSIKKQREMYDLLKEYMETVKDQRDYTGKSLVSKYLNPFSERKVFNLENPQNEYLRVFTLELYCLWRFLKIDEYKDMTMDEMIDTQWGKFEHELMVNCLAVTNQEPKYRYFLAHPLTVSCLIKDIYIRACHDFYEGVPVIQISSDNQSCFMDVQNHYGHGHNAMYWTEPDGTVAVYEASSL